MNTVHISVTDPVLSAAPITSSPAARMMRTLSLGAVAGTLMLALAGCNIDHATEIGTGAHTSIFMGTSHIMQVYEGGLPEPVTLIDANVFFSGSQYVSHGSLEIKGDIPRDVTITAYGRVIVVGDVGENTKITANLPEVTDSSDIKALEARGIIDHLAYPGDTKPGIAVTGSVGEWAKLTTNAGIQAGYIAPGADLTTGNGRGIILGKAPADEKPVTKLAIPPITAPAM